MWLEEMDWVWLEGEMDWVWLKEGKFDLLKAVDWRNVAFE